MNTGPMLINFVDTTNDAIHYTKPPPGYKTDTVYLQNDWFCLVNFKLDGSMEQPECH